MDSISLTKHGVVSELSLRTVSWRYLVLTSLLAVSCKSESAPATSAATVSPAAPTAAAPGAEPAKPTAESAAFSVSLESTGEQTVGKAGHAQLVLVPKAPFHTNPEYPYKLKLDASTGLKLASDTVTKEGAQVTPERAVFDVPFTPTAEGTHTLSGMFAFSVCKDDQCLVERQQLALPITVLAAK